MKTAGAAVYANRHYLELFRRTRPERLARDRAEGPKILDNVFIHPGAKIDPAAVVRSETRDRPRNSFIDNEMKSFSVQIPGEPSMNVA